MACQLYPSVCLPFHGVDISSIQLAQEEEQQNIFVGPKGPVIQQSRDQWTKKRVGRSGLF